MANRHRAGRPLFGPYSRKRAPCLRRLYRAAAGTPGRRKNRQSEGSLPPIGGREEGFRALVAQIACLFPTPLIVGVIASKWIKGEIALDCLGRR